MNFLLPFTTVISGSIAGMIDKINFKRNAVSPERLMALVFVSMSVSIFLFIVARWQPLPSFPLTAIWLITSIVLISFVANVFDFRSLKVNDLSSREPVRDLGPIIAGFFGYMIFPSEREAGFLVILVLSAIIVYWGSYSRQRQKKRRRGMLYVLAAVYLYALLPSLYKLSFEYFTPEYILLFRVLGVLVLSLIFISLTKKSRLPKNSMALGVSSGVMFTIAGITALYSIAVFGLIVTMFFLLLGPALRYAIGYFVLKETAHKREMFASFLLALLVSFALFF